MAQALQEMIIDTNILVDYSRLCSEASDFLHSVDHPIISAVTAMEFIQGARDKKELKMDLTLLDKFKIVEIDKNISSKAVVLMKKHNLKDDLEIPDALIAATALDKNEKLATINIKDFECIEDLEVYPPYN